MEKANFASQLVDGAESGQSKSQSSIPRICGKILKLGQASKMCLLNSKRSARAKDKSVETKKTDLNSILKARELASSAASDQRSSTDLQVKRKKLVLRKGKHCHDSQATSSRPTSMPASEGAKNDVNAAEKVRLDY